MNYLRLSLATCALMLALALSTFAGEMETPFSSPLPLSKTSEMHTPIVAEIVLRIVQGMLALF